MLPLTPWTHVCLFRGFDLNRTKPVDLLFVSFSLLFELAWKESNLRPGAYKTPARTTELHATVDCLSAFDSEWGHRDSNPGRLVKSQLLCLLSYSPNGLRLCVSIAGAN